MTSAPETAFDLPIGRWPAAWRAVLFGYVLLSLLMLAVILAGLFENKAGETASVFDGWRERVAGRAGPSASHAERLLSTGDGPFNGMGTMQPAFTTKSRDWNDEWSRRGPEDQRALESERMGERLGMLAWLQRGAEPVAYERDSFPLPSELIGQPVTRDFIDREGGLRIRSLITARCVDCHAAAGRMERAANIPLDSYERLRPFVTAPQSTRMTLADGARLASSPGLPLLIVITTTGLLFSRAGFGKRVSLLLGILPVAGFGLGIACAILARWQPDAFPGMLVGLSFALLGFVVQSIGCLAALIPSFLVPGGNRSARERSGATPP